MTLYRRFLLWKCPLRSPGSWPRTFSPTGPGKFPEWSNPEDHQSSTFWNIVTRRCEKKPNLSHFFRLLHCPDGLHLVLPHTVTSAIKSMYWARKTSEIFCTSAFDVNPEFKSAILSVKTRLGGFRPSFAPFGSLVPVVVSHPAHLSLDLENECAGAFTDCCTAQMVRTCRGNTIVTTTILVHVE